MSSSSDSIMVLDLGLSIRPAVLNPMLRDREEDLGLGYVNLPRERFGSETPAADDDALASWLGERREELEARFREGLAGATSVRPARTRRLVTLLGRRYLEQLEELRPPSPPAPDTRC